MESFTLREATKGDSEFIAELVYKTEDRIQSTSGVMEVGKK